MSVFENAANAQSASGSRDEEYLLTEGEAQLATVLALMTGFSQACCAAHRAPMAQRVSTQLARMAEGLDGCERSEGMRHFLQKLEQRWATVARVLAHYAHLSPSLDETDGISADFGQWRFNLRSSNTEPLLRLNVETRGDADLLRRRTEELSSLIAG